MTYRELLDRLLPARRFGVVLGLERMRELLDRLGAPDRKLGTVVHVAGTNGKGSTVAMVAAIAAAAGVRVAAYTSPHLSSLRERIAFAGAPISEEDIVDAAHQVSAAGGDELTFFEQLTAIGCVAIAGAEVDVTVLEVGLGGRLDATNAIAADIAVVTGIAFDHEAILGDTIAAIAAEKAGIFKRGQRAVVGASGELDASAILMAAARAAGVAELTVIDDRAIAAVPRVALAGAHQRRNAAAALAAIDHLEALGVVTAPVPVRARALATVAHPGRFERVGDVVFDGAHNPSGAIALAAALQEAALAPVAILAISSDKAAAEIVRALGPQLRGVVATRYQQDRALDPEALAAIVRAELPDLPVLVAPDIRAAIVAARTLGRGAPLVIAGSLFIVGEARVELLNVPTDPIALSDPPAVRA